MDSLSLLKRGKTGSTESKIERTWPQSSADSAHFHLNESDQPQVDSRYPNLSVRAQRALSKIKINFFSNSGLEPDQVSKWMSKRSRYSASGPGHFRQCIDFGFENHNARHTAIFYLLNSIKEAEQERQLGRTEVDRPRFEDSATALENLLKSTVVEGVRRPQTDLAAPTFKVWICLDLR